MQHNIPLNKLVESIGPQVHAMVEAIEACVHCGFCLPVCPTYQLLGEEMDSPRGRILLMKSVLEGDLTPQETQDYMDHCLGCQACVTACPSGVQYQALLMPYRAYFQKEDGSSILESVQKALISQTLPYPKRFRPVAVLGTISRPFQDALPEIFQNMLRMLPSRISSEQPYPEVYRPEGAIRARVALLTGCVQQVLAPEINWATLRVLQANGVEVIIPTRQACCGGLLMHNGKFERARRLAEQNLNAFSADVDAIISNAAGCGSAMKEYGLLFQGTDKESRAREFAACVMDVTQFLETLDIPVFPRLPQDMRVAYHDACHLVHAQQVRDAPRNLLAKIPNLTLLELENADLCCGSAGTYNLEQPALATLLASQKVEKILGSGAEAVVMGNIGCMMQIRTHLKQIGKPLPVFHTIELLDLAYSRQA